MKFRIVENRLPIAGRLIYSVDDYAFSTEPHPEGCATSVSINELELMLNGKDGRVVFVTGYCPHTGWQSSTLIPPPVRHRGHLYAMLDKDIVHGASKSLQPPNERWPVLVDQSTGWVRLGKGEPDKDRVGIEFAPGAIAVLAGDQLVAIWLHPDQSAPKR